jgi:hypothetical protein
MRCDEVAESLIALANPIEGFLVTRDQIERLLGTELHYVLQISINQSLDRLGYILISLENIFSVVSKQHLKEMPCVTDESITHLLS